MLKITHQDNKTSARTGRLKTKSGTIETPFFMPVATKADVKLMTPDMLKQINTKAIISNSLLLSLYPGTRTIEKFGGIHQFMNFRGVIATDSGGFQIIREGFEPKIDNFGLYFKNPYTGKNELLSPVKAIQIQNSLNSDIIMCLDDMLLIDSKKERIEQGVKRTFEWAKICYHTHNNNKKSQKNRKQLLFGITQGGTNKQLRKKSIALMTSLDFDGYSIGGLAIGEKKKDMFKIVRFSCNLLPKDKPRYLMGVGSPPELLEAMSLGVDMFDSVYPTRTARRNSLLTRKGPLKILNSRYKDDKQPVEKDCRCCTCRNFSRAYLHHMARSKEFNGMMLNTIHNLHFVIDLMEQARMHIKENSFLRFKNRFIKNYRINSPY
ncbi:MAG: tRNA guanosine(34) transglycosylase Tgt [Candidatus Woesearchaeota archaeon]